MVQYIDKSALVAEIKSKRKYAQTLGDNAINSSMQQFYDGMKQSCVDILSFIDTLEVKEVVAEQEGVCNNIFNRIIGDNWNLSIPLDKAGLKHGDKVKIFITKEK